MDHKVDHKGAFLKAAHAAILLLFIAGVLIWVLITNNGVSPNDGFSCFNLLVDMVVGFFTVWGLYWAASEFVEAQEKPKLRLVLGKVNGGITPIRNSSLLLEGRRYAIDRQKIVKIGLFLENDKPKAGLYVRVMIRICATPPPTKYKFNHRFIEPESFPHKGADFLEVTLQYGDDLVVYQTSNLLGFLNICWEYNQTPPKKMELEYRIFTLNGPPTRSASPQPIDIDWQE
jgi:hypothetical protein